MLLSTEPLGDRWRRRMREKKAAKMAAAASAPKPRELSVKAAAIIAERDHQKTIKAELAAIDAHAAHVEQLLGEPTSRGIAVGPGASGGRVSFKEQELRAEVGALRALRREIESDLDHPIVRDRDGKPLTARARQLVRARSAELKEILWAQAQMAERQGDHRRARQLRYNSIRARHVAEFEAHLRPSLAGYTSGRAG